MIIDILFFHCSFVDMLNIISTCRDNVCVDINVDKRCVDHSTSGYSDPFCKNLNERSLTPRWPLTPHLLRSHVWLYPRIIVSKAHENKSKYVDTVTLFAKTLTKGHWPLDDLWPHICLGHMCDSTRGPLCPNPMGIHQCMWIQWSILQITTYILRTYYIQNEWSHSLFLNSVQARQKWL